MSRSRGFTLIEFLVALLVMAVMAAMAWRGVDGISQSRQLNSERLDRTLRMQTVLTQWEQDLHALQDSHVVPALGFDGATLRLTRRTPEGLQVVAWSVRGGSWWRWAGPSVAAAQPMQQQWLASQQLLGNETGHLKMLEGVPRWQVYCFRGSGWSNCQSSDDIDVPDAPPPPASGASAPAPRRVPRVQLPTGVRVVLSFIGETDPKLTRDVTLAPQMP